METTSFASSSSSSSSSSPQSKMFDVFLSFRGEDTRNNFTAHLSLALRKIGLFSIFKDDYALQKGKDMGPELMKAIEDSQNAVVVLSENYATSSWCLKELAKIVNCMGDSGRIRTIFYHVNPSHVRNVVSTDVEKQQESSFWKALEEHSKNPTHSKELESWRIALVKVANQSGYRVEAHTEEAIFIKEFVANLSSEIGASTRTMEGLFGMTPRLEKLDSYVLDHSLDSDNVCFLGIHGMGGIGKSTLAKAYYNKMSHKFDGRSFLENVREVCEKNANGLVHLQKQLLKDILGEDFQIGHAGEGIDLIRSRLCAKKVLIILDDVNDLGQLEALADSHRKKQGSENELDIWFGSGSVIIVTTRNEDSLKERYEIYRAQQFDENEALQLFSWKAFERIEPPYEFKKLSEKVVEYASYLPLALTVLGSLLRRKEKSEWESVLCRLRKCPEKKIVEKLKISFDDLDKADQAIFLDIACFFTRCDKDKVIEILDSCGFTSKYGIRNLIDKSLLSIDQDGMIWMHDLLQEMGKDMGRQSRIWNKDQLNEILENREGTDQVEAIVTYHETVNSFRGLEYYIKALSLSTKEYSFEALSSMKKLRLLRMKKLRLLKIESNPKYGEPKLSIAVGCMPYFDWLGHCDAPELSNNLQYLDWTGFPYKKLSSSFQPSKLVQLRLRDGNIKQLWNDCVTPLSNLKVIDLSYSLSFAKFEGFTVVPNLEKLILQHCEKLSEIHSSIKNLKKLVLLDLQGCISLKKLPEEINQLASLQTLLLYNCYKIEKLPDNLEQLKSLRILDIEDTGIKHLPSSIFRMKNLESLSCHHDLEIESAVRENIISYRTTGKCFSLGWICTSLKWLDLSDCNLSGPEAFPEYFGKLACLEYLDLSKNPFSLLPPGINGLSSLTTLRLEHWKSLTCLDAELLPSSLEVVSVNYCTSLASFLDPLKPCHLRCSRVYCVDCTELVKNQDGKMTALASLTRFLENPHKRRDFEDFRFVVPQSSDNELPSWFINQSSTGSITIKVEPNKSNLDLIGIAMVFCFRANSSTKDNFPCDIRVCCSEIWRKTKQLGLIYSGMSDHLFLLYSPFPQGLIDDSYYPLGFDDTFEFSFLGACGWCGVRFVYKEDIEEFKEITSKYINDHSSDQKDVQSSHSQSWQLEDNQAKLRRLDLEDSL